MGNADSKAAAEEDGTFALNTTAPQKNNSREATDSSSSTPEKREANDKNNSNRNGGVSNRDGGSGGGGGEHSPIKKNAARNPIRDDQINVNMPMADLMAYLQVVANNSNHLPLTRRDDPELDRTVSSLTSEDYARKSAAFVPSDVRVIGGTFSRYGRVWDLPTSEVRSVAYRKSFSRCLFVSLVSCSGRLILQRGAHHQHFWSFFLSLLLYHP